MARGFQKGWQAGLKARGTDIVVNNRTGGLTPKPFDASIREQIAKLPKIAATCNILVEITSVENSDLMILSGREWGSFCWNNLELVSGRMPQDATEEAAVLGQTAADVLKKKVGDPIQIETKQLTGRGNRERWRDRRRWIGHPFLTAIAGDHGHSQSDQRN